MVESMKSTVFTLILFALQLCAGAHPRHGGISAYLIYSADCSLEANVVFTLEELQQYFKLDSLNSGLYLPELEGELQKELQKKSPRIIDIQQKGTPAPAFLKEVLIETVAEPTPGQPIALSEVDITLTILFALQGEPQSLHCRWRLALEESRRISFISDSVTNFDVTADKPAFTWINQAPAYAEASPAFHWQKEIIRSHSLNSFYLMLLLSALSFCFWVLCDRQNLRTWVILLLLTGGGLCSLFSDLETQHWRQIAALPENTELEKLISRRLRSIYQASLQSNPEIILDNLQKSCSEAYCRSLFPQLIAAQHQESTKALEEIQISRCQKVANNQVHCSWSLKQLVRHRNHLHSRKLHFSTVFSLVVEEDTWKLTSGKILPVYGFQEEESSFD
jgi:hypothetical protein